MSPTPRLRERCRSVLNANGGAYTDEEADAVIAFLVELAHLEHRTRRAHAREQTARSNAHEDESGSEIRASTGP